MGIDALIVKAGNTSVVKKNAEAKSGRISISSRSRIDKVYFCYDYELEATNSAAGTASGAFNWEITKTVTPMEQAKFAGEKANFDYVVGVHKLTESLGNFNIVSKVEIKNNTPLDAKITSITDLFKPSDIEVSLDCGISDLPYTLPAGHSITCSASTQLVAPVYGQDSVQIKTSGDVGGTTTSNKIKWTGWSEAQNSVTVVDTSPAFGGPYIVSADTSWAYSDELSCPADPSQYVNGALKLTHENIAKMVGSGKCACTTVKLSCYKLDVTTSAIGTGEAAGITWDITKSVTPAEQVKFAGEKAKFDYTVAVTKHTGGSGNGGFQVAAKVEINNNTPLDATIYSITDTLTGDIPVTLDCGISAYPYTLKSGKTLTCTGTVPVDTKLDGENLVSVKSNSDLSASSKIDWSAAGTPGTSGPDTVTVTDTNAAFGGSQTVSSNKTWTYPVELACPVDPSAYANGPVTVTLDNTAAISETAQKASQSVKVTCYKLDVTTSAIGSGSSSTITWNITKDVSPAEQVKFAGEKAKFDYTVAVKKLVTGGNGYSVAVKVEVKNNTPLDATINSITDTLTGDIPVTLDCGISAYPYTLLAGKSITCTSTVPLSTKLDGENLVSVKSNSDLSASSKIDWSAAGTPGTSGPDVVTVTDTNAGFGGSQTVSSNKTWTYPVELACPVEQSAYANGPVTVTLDNTAAITETGQKASQSVKVTCYKLDVTTSAIGSGSSSTITWEITKDVTPAAQVNFAGEKAKFDYTVAVKKLVTGGNGYEVAVKVEVKNATPLDATINSITDTLTPGDIPVTLDCGISAYPYTLKAGNSLTCTGTVPLNTKLDGENLVSVKSNSDVSASSKIDWSGAGTPGTSGPDSVTVTDTNAAFGGSQTVSDSKSWTYPVELACPVEQSAYANGPVTVTLDNTATITETGQNASKTVSVTCHAPTLSPALNASYDALYTWGITKTSPVTSLELEIGQIANVEYNVTVDLVETKVSNVKLSGAITLANSNPGAALSATLTDEITPGVFATFTDCTNPVTIPANGSLTCNFAADTVEKPAGVNTATLTFNGLTWTATTAYDSIGTVKNETDECVAVWDGAFDNPLGTTCAANVPGKYSYTLQVGPFPKCGLYGTTNTAWFVTNDTQTEGDVQYNIPITVNCPLVTNCTKPESYWAAKSNKADPANYDTVWNLIPNLGPDTLFYTTGYTWVEMILTPTTGSPYNALAHAYITARLNVLFGAKTPTAVTTAMVHADALLKQYANNQAAITGAVLSDFNTTALKINDFNSALTGPIKCPGCQYN